MIYKILYVIIGVLFVINIRSFDQYFLFFNEYAFIHYLERIFTIYQY